jgi:N-acetylmuramoyl-L-alanine amidase
MRQTLRHHAAIIRPMPRVLLALLIFLSLFPRPASADNDASTRRETAKSQFDRAEKDRQALESRPENIRSLKDYISLVSTYRRVALITPRAPEVPQALNQVAELYRAMGDLFEEKYYQSSIDSYQFLLREYPTSRYREDAMLAVASIEQNDLHDYVLAKTSYEGFLTLHPRSSHAAKVRAILEKLNAASTPPKPDPHAPSATEQPGQTLSRAPVKTVATESGPATTDTRQGSSGEAPVADGGVPQVSRIRSWNADSYTRVVIDVGSKVKYQTARISGPDRIYFDIEGAKISSAILHKQIDVAQGGFLKTVRIAQNQLGVVRVVLEVNNVKDYSVFLLPDPYRLVVDVYGNSAAAKQAARATTPAPGPTTEIPTVKMEKAAKDSTAITASKIPDKPAPQSAAVIAGNTEAPRDDSKREQMPAPRTSPFTPPIPASLVPPVLPQQTQPRPETTASASSKNSSKPAPKPAVTASAKYENARNDIPVEPNISLPAALVGDSMPSPVLPLAPAKKPGRKTKSAHDQAEEMGPAPTPELTRDGQHSLTRALGLKIGRIVIDAGHGGHDTGTIGPTGLMEKDLCLDVALRVGKLIQQRLPGAEVIYTRDDDTFIPLEHRTEIANEARADLFLSVHANSSDDHKARGVETYYLNFTGSSAAMEVASRENALSENSVYDLQDIVKQIARNEKIEESRDFAGIIQDSLAQRMQNMNRGERNRGVRKAPFVVLIGANMPSVLAEISFLSNPSDEQWLKKPENRQRVAEGLYHGIESYLHNTNSLTYDQNHPAPESRAGILARSGNPQ